MTLPVCTCTSGDVSDDEEDDADIGDYGEKISVLLGSDC